MLETSGVIILYSRGRAPESPLYSSRIMMIIVIVCVAREPFVVTNLPANAVVPSGTMQKNKTLTTLLTPDC